MSANDSIDVLKIISALKQLRHNISVPDDFSGIMELIKRLRKNDKTGMVSTVLNFMTNASNVPMLIETKDEKLNKLFSNWQKNINANVNVDIPRGFRELSNQFYNERLWTSFIGLVIIWEEVGKGKDKVDLPRKMYFVDGSNIYVDGNKTTLDGKKYYLGKDKKIALDDSANKTVIIRKPYNAWYEDYPTPYLAKHGVLFNALLKEAIINKQADVIQQIIPYLLLMKAGTDKLAELGMLADETDMQELKQKILNAKNEADITGELGKYFATLNYDVNLEHFIPDLSKILNENILKSTDKNILAGLGMIELEGFQKTREESIMNPKLLIEECKDAVMDWKSILEEVLAQIKERNSNRSFIAEMEETIIPGRIQTFMTDEMRQMLRSCADRGIISYHSEQEDLAEVNPDIEHYRIEKEKKEGLRDLYEPKPSQVVDTKNNENVPDNKKKNTPESKNFTNQ